jgi:DnaJ-class molecular chaperone
MEEDFYNILGVSEKSSKEEIKKAFRSLSMKWHPDKNQKDPNAVGMFQKINEAYETLGDDSKRSEYDNMKQNPFMRMNTFNQGMNGDVDNFLNTLFGNVRFFNENSFSENIQTDPFIGMPGGPRIHLFQGGPFGFQNIQKPTPIIKNLNMNIENILSRSKLPFDIERWIMIGGAKVFESETIYVDIPEGIDDNEIIIIRDKGNIVNDNCKGDIKLIIKVINNTHFKRQGLDLFIEKEISLKESLCGFSFEIKHINGKSYTLNNSIGNIIEPEYKKIIPNMGLKRENVVGNLILHFHVKFPSKITQDQIEKLKEIL